MKRKLYLHIGTHRTATSSIQKFLQSNFCKLIEKGVFHPHAAARHSDLVGKLFQPGNRNALADCAADIIARAEAKPHPIHSITISDEDLSSRKDLSPIEGLMDHFDVKIVLFLRRQDLWLESWYQQNVKWQWNPDLAHLTFAEFMARRQAFFWIDYDSRLRSLEWMFGAENVICRVFEKGQMPQGPIAAFCDAIGLKDRTGLTSVPTVNGSLSPVMTEFMRLLPLDQLPAAQRHEVEKACAQADAHRAAESRLYLPAKARAAFMSDYARGNTAVARRYFGRDHLFLDPLPTAQAPLADPSLPIHMPDLFRELVAPVITALSRPAAGTAEAATTPDQRSDAA
jgi:hypothetical protein